MAHNKKLRLKVNYIISSAEMCSDVQKETVVMFHGETTALLTSAVLHRESGESSEINGNWRRCIEITFSKCCVILRGFRA